ncbi:hypothetical protein ACLBVD_37295, partial [Pseudomonas aeruginosa]
ASAPEQQRRHRSGRLAGIVQQIYYRYYHGQTQDKRFAQFVQMNKLLEQMSLQAIERSRL